VWISELSRPKPHSGPRKPSNWLYPLSCLPDVSDIRLSPTVIVSTHKFHIISRHPSYYLRSLFIHKGLSDAGTHRKRSQNGYRSLAIGHIYPLEAQSSNLLCPCSVHLPFISRTRQRNGVCRDLSHRGEY